MRKNPLLEPWTGAFGAPPLDAITPGDFRPAFDVALEAHRGEVAAIAADPAPATFENTVAALERSGRALERVERVFDIVTGAETSSELQALERELAPRLARHRNDIQLTPGLFDRLQALADADLSPEQSVVLKRWLTALSRAGASLETPAKARLVEISGRLAELQTLFGQNVLTDEQAFVMPLEEDDLDGLPDFARASAGALARARALDAPYAVTLLRSSVEPFLQFSARRDLREKAFHAWAARGENGGSSDNRALLKEIVDLRTEQARLMGYDSFAAYKLADTMAGTPEAVTGLLDRVWAAARGPLDQDRAALQQLAVADGLNGELAAWDWRYYAEKARKARFDIAESEIKPYLPLEAVIAAAFDVAGRLFGLSFEPRDDVPVYHPDVRVWNVTSGSRHVGLFYGDYFARPSKRSGAWMTAFRDQAKLDHPTTPLILNVLNLNKGEAGEPTLLSFDDARTLFHELGHGLHGLLSDVTYPSVSGTAVLQDFVELPSQLFEHWLSRPEVLDRFARHYRTGEPMPVALRERLVASGRFNQAAGTAEYLASAYVDLAFHLDGVTDAAAAEAQVRDRMDLPPQIALRHRPAHFQHAFTGSHYAAGYYCYLWAEVLDADAFAAFGEAGDAFDPGVARRLRDHVYAAGGSVDPVAAYEAFRGRMPSIEPLLAKRGFAEQDAAIPSL
jgi:peptidyl-dipeptidase Dcp